MTKREVIIGIIVTCLDFITLIAVMGIVKGSLMGDSVGMIVSGIGMVVSIIIEFLLENFG